MNPAATQPGAEPPPTPYDAVAYPGYTHPQTHPDRLATIARLHGLNPAPVSTCRVLELGCGNGSNLLPLACHHPGGRFVGIDLAARPIAAGQRAVAQLGLGNLDLRVGDLTAIDASWGRFDFIIAHGLYSWVPEGVRDHLLAVCRTNLAEQGVAFVSYNTFPGAHLRQMVREMMLFHVRGLSDPAQRVAQAKAFVRFIGEGAPGDSDYHRLMRGEAVRVTGYQEGHLFHDDLAEVNHPVHFHQFAAHAARHGLQYLGEADLFDSSARHLPPETRRLLPSIERDRILWEQYLDFLKCRRFRQTLLCHCEHPVRLHPEARLADGYLVSGRATIQRTEGDLAPGGHMRCKTGHGATLETDFVPGKAALVVLANEAPRPIGLDELAARARALLDAKGVAHGGGGVEQDEELLGFLLNLGEGGFVEFHSTVPSCCFEITPRPDTSPLVRWQAREGSVVTSALHTTVELEDETGRLLLQLLDGSLNHAELADRLFRFIEERGAFSASAPADEAGRRRLVEADLERNLKKLAKAGLLTG